MFLISIYSPHLYIQSTAVEKGKDKVRPYEGLEFFSISCFVLGKL